MEQIPSQHWFALEGQALVTEINSLGITTKWYRCCDIEKEFDGDRIKAIRMVLEHRESAPGHSSFGTPKKALTTTYPSFRVVNPMAVETLPGGGIEFWAAEPVELPHCSICAVAPDNQTMNEAVAQMRKTVLFKL